MRVHDTAGLCILIPGVKSGHFTGSVSLLFRSPDGFEMLFINKATVMRFQLDSDRGGNTQHCPALRDSDIVRRSIRLPSFWLVQNLNGKPKAMVGSDKSHNIYTLLKLGTRRGSPILVSEKNDTFFLDTLVQNRGRKNYFFFLSGVFIKTAQNNEKAIISRNPATAVLVKNSLKLGNINYSFNFIAMAIITIPASKLKIKGSRKSDKLWLRTNPGKMIIDPKYPAARLVNISLITSIWLVVSSIFLNIF